MVRFCILEKKMIVGQLSAGYKASDKLLGLFVYMLLFDSLLYIRYIMRQNILLSTEDYNYTQVIIKAPISQLVCKKATNK